jgi:hypothetical protein
LARRVSNTFDVDITLDYKHFDDVDYKDHPATFDPFDDGSSKNQIAKYSDRLKGWLLKALWPNLHLDNINM